MEWLGWSFVCLSPARCDQCRVRNIYEALERMEQRVLLVVPAFATVSQGLLFLLVCSTFFLASFVDPGIYPRGKSTLDPHPPMHQQPSPWLLSVCLSVCLYVW